MFRHLIKAGILAAGLCLCSHASAATQMVDADGELIGAIGVVISGATFDVMFVDGACSVIFGGCNSVSDFTFSGSIAGSLASQALLDQVFQNTALGDFDSLPHRTFGCGFVAECLVLTPTGLSLAPGFFSGSFTSNTSAVDSVGNFDYGRLQNTGFDGTLVFAVFTPSTVSPVPEPGTWALMLVGYGAIGLGMRRSRRKRYSGSADRSTELTGDAGTDEFAFPSRVEERVTAIGLRREVYGTHSLRRTKAA